MILKLLEQSISILLVIAILGPSIRYYDKKSKVRFMFDGLIIVIGRIIYFAIKKESE